MKIWEQLLRDNGPGEWALAGTIMLAVLVAVWVARGVAVRLVTRFARTTTAQIDDALADTVRATRLWLLLPLAVYAGASALQLPARLDRLLESAAMVALVAQFAVWANRLVLRWLALRAQAAGTTDPPGGTPAHLLRVCAP